MVEMVQVKWRKTASSGPACSMVGRDIVYYKAAVAKLDHEWSCYTCVRLAQTVSC